MVNNSYPHNPQAPYVVPDEVVDITEFADELPPVVAPRHEVEEFFTRLEPVDRPKVKWAIITAWQRKVFDGTEAIFWLTACGFKKPTRCTDPERWMAFYVASERKRAEGEAA